MAIGEAVGETLRAPKLHAIEAASRKDRPSKIVLDFMVNPYPLPSKEFTFLYTKNLRFFVYKKVVSYTINATATISRIGVITDPTHSKKDTGRRGKKR